MKKYQPKQKPIVKVKTTCKSCGSPIEQDGKRSMKRCPGCSAKWFFSINIDGTVHLFTCRPKTDEAMRKRPRSISISKHDEQKAKSAGFGLTELTEIGYRVAVLGLTFDGKQV